MRERAPALRALLRDVTPGARPLALCASNLPLAAFPAGVSLALYLPCLARQVTSSRAGELLAALALDELPPAPAHPVWTLLARALETIAPAAPPVLRAALLSALISSLTVALWTLWLRQLDVGRRAALSAGLCLAFGLSTWRLAVTPEALPLMSLLTAAACVAITQWRATRTRAWLVVLGTTLTVGLLETVQFAPAAAILASLLVVGWRSTAAGPGCVGSLAGGAALGLLPAAWAWSCGATLWGPVSREWLTGATQRPPVTLLELLTALGREHCWMGLGLAIVGLTIGGRHQPRVKGFLLALCVLPMLWFHALDELLPQARAPDEVGTQLGLIILALSALTALGIDAILQRHAAGSGWLAYGVAGVLACLPVVLIVRHLPRADYSDYQVAGDHAAHLLAHVPHGGVLRLGRSPDAGLVRHALFVEGLRSDVLIDDPDGQLLVWELASEPFDAYDPPRIAALSATHRVFATQRSPLPPSHDWVAHGLLWRLAAHGVESTPPAPPSEPWDYRDLPPHPPVIVRPGAPFDATAHRIAVDYYLARSRYLRSTGQVQAAEALRRRTQDLEAQ